MIEVVIKVMIEVVIKVVIKVVIEVVIKLIEVVATVALMVLVMTAARPARFGHRACTSRNLLEPGERRSNPLSVANLAQDVGVRLLERAHRLVAQDGAGSLGGEPGVDKVAGHEVA